MRIALLLFLLLTACSRQPAPTAKDLDGKWKFVGGSEKKRPIFPTITFLQKLTEGGHLLLFDGKQTGFLDSNAVLINPFQYETRNDTVITHTRGYDIKQKFRFDTRDTLWLYDKDSIVMKYVRVM